MGLERGQNRLTAVFRHDLMEPGIPRIRYSAALPEALNDVILDGAKDRNVLCEDRQIIGGSRPRKVRSMLRRE